MLPLAPRVTGKLDTNVQMAFDRLVQYLRSGAAGPGDVLWQPGAVSRQNRVATWAEVMQFVAASTSPITIWVEWDAGDPPLSVPPGVYEMNQAQIVSTRFGDPTAQQILLADGAQLRNVRQVLGSLTLVGNSTGLACLAMDPTPFVPAIFLFGYGAAVQNLGTAPMIEAPPPFGFVVLAFPTTGQIQAGASPVVNLVNATLWVQAYDGQTYIDPASIGGDAASVLVVSHNGNLSSSTFVPGTTLPTFTSFAGFVVNNPWGTNGGSGPTAPAPGIAGRPLGLFGPITLGCSYFDVSLGATGLPIWFDNNGVTGWADSAGVPA